MLGGMSSDTIFARLKVIGARRFQKEMDDSGTATEGLGSRARDARRGLGELQKGTVSLGAGLRALMVVAAIAAGAQGLGLLVQATGAGIVALGALGVAAIGAGAVLGGFAMGAAARFKQMADVGGSAANELKTRFGEFKSLLSDELGPAFDPVFGALATALGPIGALVREISPAFSVLGRAVAEGVSAAAGALAGMGPEIATLITGVAQLVPALVPALTGLFHILLLVANAAMPYLIQGLEWLTQKMSGLSAGDVTGFVSRAFSTLGDVFRTVVDVVRLVAPVFLSVVGAIRQVATGALPGLIDGVKSLAPAFQAIVDSGALKTMATVIGDVFGKVSSVVGKVVTELNKVGLLKPVILGIAAAFTVWKTATLAVNLAMRANPMMLLVTAIAALVVGVIYAYRRFEGFRKVIDTVWGVIKSVFGWITDHWPLVLSILTGPIGAAVIFIARNFGKIKSVATSVVSWVKDRFTSLVSFVSGLPGKIASAASGLFNGIKNAFRSAVNWIISKWNDLSFHIGGTDLGPFGHLPEANLNTPNIPLLADGGTVKGIGSWITGEAGPELNTKFPNGDVRVEPLGKPAVPPAQAATRGRSAAAPRQQARGSRDVHITVEVAKQALATAMARIYDDIDAGVPV